MSLIALILLAAFIGYAHAKDKIDTTWVTTTKLVVSLSAPLWLGGLLSIAAAFLIFQAVYIPVRNKFEGQDIWFIDEETFFGEKAVEYFGVNGGRVLYISEFIFALLILIV